jgi:hypothetical protein
MEPTRSELPPTRCAFDPPQGDRLGLQTGLGRNPPFPHCRHQALIVALVLARIRGGKVRNSPVENITLPEVGGNGHSVPGVESRQVV